ncbi:hypothetical protein V8E53_005995 [Lactarius tabidus]
MPSRHRQPPPHFPYTPSAPAAVPMPNGANNHLSVGHAQDYGRSPQVGRSPRTIPSPLLPPSEPLSPQYQSAYPPTSQHTLVSGRHHPPEAFLTPQVHSTYAPNTHLTQPRVPPRAPTTHSEPPPSRMQRSVSMRSPGRYSDSQVPRGHYQSSALQAPVMSPSQSYSGTSGATRIPSGHRRNQDGSDDERDWSDRDTSVMHRSDTIPKGRPSRPLVGMLNPPHRSAAGGHSSANGSGSGIVARLLDREVTLQLRIKHIHKQLQSCRPPSLLHFAVGGMTVKPLSLVIERHDTVGSAVMTTYRGELVIA